MARKASDVNGWATALPITRCDSRGSVRARTIFRIARRSRGFRRAVLRAGGRRRPRSRSATTCGRSAEPPRVGCDARAENGEITRVQSDARARRLDLRAHDRADGQRRHAVSRRFAHDELERSIGHAAHVTIHPLLRVERAPDGELVAVRSPRTSGVVADGRQDRIVHPLRDRARDRRRAARQDRNHSAKTRCATFVRPSKTGNRCSSKLRVAADELRNTKSLPAAEMLAESCAFLEWLASNNFTLLGYREYELVHGEEFDELKTRPGTGLGVLRDDAANRDVLRLVGAAREEAHSKNPLVITKANRRSTVHRPAPLDYVGVKVFGADGQPRSRTPFPRAVYIRRVQPKPTRHPALAAQGSAADAGVRPRSEESSRQIAAAHPGYAAPRRSDPRLDRRPARDQRGHARPPGTAPLAAVLPP